MTQLSPATISNMVRAARLPMQKTDSADETSSKLLIAVWAGEQARGQSDLARLDRHLCWRVFDAFESERVVGAPNHYCHILAGLLRCRDAAWALHPELSNGMITATRRLACIALMRTIPAVSKASRRAILLENLSELDLSAHGPAIFGAPDPRGSKLRIAIDGTWAEYCGSATCASSSDEDWDATCGRDAAGCSTQLAAIATVDKEPGTGHEDALCSAAPPSAHTFTMSWDTSVHGVATSSTEMGVSEGPGPEDSFRPTHLAPGVP
jgi:hypothetical protein